MTAIVIGVLGKMVYLAKFYGEAFKGYSAMTDRVGIAQILKQEKRRYQYTLLRNLGLILALAVVGTTGYRLIERWSWFDALYMTVITLATIGYGETYPLSLEGREFTIGLIIAGVTTLTYIATQFTVAVSQGHFRYLLQLRRQESWMNSLDHHYIICGYGRTGRQVTAEFAAEGIPFVVIDSEAQALEELSQIEYPHVQGDATLDSTLLYAGIERAVCIVLALPSDAENLYAVLSAKTLNPNIRAIARASTEEAIQKLRRGGADEVISPYITGGKRMAAAALRPQVMDFVDGIITGANRSFYIEEFRIDGKSCPYLGTSLKEARLRSQTGALVLAIRRSDGILIAGPNADSLILEGDLLICMGTSEQLRELNQVLSPLPHKTRSPRPPRNNPTDITKLRGRNDDGDESK
jgi:voltage-gated potassium channel